jgi:hypothetical protein
MARLSIPSGVEEAVVTGLFALAATLLTAALTWFHDHGISAQRTHLLEEANKRLALWDQWLKVVGQLPEPIEKDDLVKIKNDMVSLANLLETSSRSLRDELVVQKTEDKALTIKVEELPTWRRWLLLYRPYRSIAWLPRIFFYIGALSIAFDILRPIVGFHHFIVEPLQNAGGFKAAFSNMKFRTATLNKVRVAFSEEAIVLAGTMLFRVFSELLERPILGQMSYPFNAPKPTEQSKSD